MDPEPHFHIAQGEDVQGPFPRARLLEWIQEGRVRSDMMFSRNGSEWAPGHAYPELFPPSAASAQAPAPVPVRPAVPPAMPPAVPPARVGGGGTPRARGARRVRRGGHEDDGGGGRPRRGAPRRGRVRPPTSVLTVSILDFVFAVLGLIAAIVLYSRASQLASMNLIETLLYETEFEGGLDGLISALRTYATILLISALLNLVMGIWIRSGKPAARGVHYVVTGLTLLANGYGLLRGTASAGSVIGLALQVWIIVQLSSASASAFFAGRPPPESRSGRASRRRRIP